VFRLRNYDPKLDVMLSVFEPNESTLLDNEIHGYFLFKVETEPFTDYDEEATFIRLINWQEPKKPAEV
jgi:hypothetical protein